jgi:hypothetical protein
MNTETITIIAVVAFCLSVVIGLVIFIWSRTKDTDPARTPGPSGPSGPNGPSETPTSPSGFTAPGPALVAITFNSLQTIRRQNLHVNVAADDGTGRTNSISDGSFISTWGITATGYTHIRIGTGDRILRITSLPDSPFNFYGYFVDTFGNKLATSPFATVTNLTDITLLSVNTGPIAP